MSVLDKYEPKDVLAYFEEICSIPHGSGNVDRISDYLVRFAKERKLTYRQDSSKNVIIWKDASVGYEGKDPVIIQGHMDMVAVKTDDCDKDMENDGLDLEVIDGDFISAIGTSLGGDDGIAVAYALAILADDSLEHPLIEAIFTVDEEVGMLGAAALDTSDIKGKILLNIDSEDEGVFTVSCAGGQCDLCSIPVNRVNASGNITTISIAGLLGGHSGVDINKGRMNAIVSIGRILRRVMDKYPDAMLVSIDGGEKDNAIARFADARILIPDGEDSDEIKAFVENEFSIILKEYSAVEKNAYIKVETSTKNENVITKEKSRNVIDSIISIPDGIVRMNLSIEGMVQTSLNMGIVKTSESEVIITSLLRSSNDSEKEYLSRRIEAIIAINGGSVQYQGVYPGWAYKDESRLRDVMISVYKEQYGSEPIVEGIHAGLECGLFAEKIEGLDCISFGPRIDDIHTTNEKLSISSVERTWKLIKETLRRI